MILLKLEQANGGIMKKATIFNKRYFWWMSFEILLALLHPNLGFHSNLQFFYTRIKLYNKSNLVSNGDYI